MTYTPHPPGPVPSGVSASLATVMATVLFFALAIAGLGALSFFTDTDIIAVPGLGQAPGVWGMLAAVAAFAFTVFRALRPKRPTYTSVVIVALITPLAHLVVGWLVLVVQGKGLVTATTVAGDFLWAGTSLVLLFAAAVSSWGGVALRRTRSAPPRWRWEQQDQDDE